MFSYVIIEINAERFVSVVLSMFILYEMTVSFFIMRFMSILLWYMLYKVKKKMQTRDLTNTKLTNLTYKNYAETPIFNWNCKCVRWMIT